jgi:hypothetical protein
MLHLYIVLGGGQSLELSHSPVEMVVVVVVAGKLVVVVVVLIVSKVVVVVVVSGKLVVVVVVVCGGGLSIPLTALAAESKKPSIQSSMHIPVYADAQDATTIKTKNTASLMPKTI